MFFTANTKNWNSIDVTLLQQNNQAEITRLYNLTKDFFLWFFKRDEELFHDLILRVVSRVHLYDPQRSSFHNFLYTMAVNMQNNKHAASNNKHHVRTCNTDIATLQSNLRIEYPEWSIEHKVELEVLLIMLPPADRLFLEDYITRKKELRKHKNKYSRIIKKLREMYHSHFP